MIMGKRVKVEIGQLKIEPEKNLWIATLMLGEGRLILGSINLHACKKYPKLKEDFTNMMKCLVRAMIDDLIDSDNETEIKEEVLQ